MDDSRAVFIMIESIKDTTERVEARVIKLEDKFDRKLESRDKQCKIDQKDIRENIEDNKISIAKLVAMITVCGGAGGSIAALFVGSMK